MGGGELVASVQQQALAAAEPAATQFRRVVCLGGWGRGMVASLQQQARPPQSQQQHNHVELYVAGGVET